MLILSLKNRVIFDIHEDFLSSIPVKFNSKLSSFLIKQVLSFLLRLSSHRFYFVLAEADYQRKYNSKLSTALVMNFPDTQMLKNSRVLDRNLNDKVKLLYIGSVTVERGAETMCDIVKLLNQKSCKERYELHLIGDGPSLSKIKPAPYITMHGRLDLLRAYEFSKSCTRPSLLHPTENYLNSIRPKF